MSQNLVNKGVKYRRSKSEKEQQARIKERNRRAQKVCLEDLVRLLSEAISV